MPRFSQPSLGSNLVKIGETAKILGVSIDTVRRWTASGKLASVRTPGGTRMYDKTNLVKLTPQPVVSFVPKEETILITKKSFAKKWLALAGTGAVTMGLIVGLVLGARERVTGKTASAENGQVLAEAIASSSAYLEINTDVVFNGKVNLPSTDNSFTINTNSDTNSLTVIGNVILDQNLSQASSPTFANLTLAAGTIVLEDVTQTLTNKTISGSSNTLSNIPNSALSNSKITINTSGLLSGGGDVSLGSSLSLSVADNPNPTFTTATISGTLGVGGEASFSAKLILDSATAQINATNNQNLQLGFQNTGQIQFLNGTNYIDANGNLYLNGVLVSSGSVQGFWQRNLGTLAPINITDSLNLGATATSSALVHLAGTAGENSFFDTGKLGIGTRTPDKLLHLYRGSVDAGTEIQIDTPGVLGSQQAQLLLTTKGDGVGGLGLANNKGWAMFGRGNAWGTAAEQNDFGLAYWDGSTWYDSTLSIDSLTQAVGIGTTTPTALLQVFGDSNLQVASISARSGKAALLVDNTIGDLFTASSSGLSRFVIKQNGNVGIGTSVPGAMLNIGNAGSTLGTLRLEGNTSGYVQLQPSAVAGSWTMTLPSSAGSAGQVMTTDGAGNISFGWPTDTFYPNKVIVDASGHGDFTTVKAAMDWGLPNRQRLLIHLK